MPAPAHHPTTPPPNASTPQAFKNYDEAGNPRRVQCLKYRVLASMLAESSVDPFDAQEAKPYKSDPEITAMTALVDAYQGNNIGEFERVLRTNRWGPGVAPGLATTEPGAAASCRVHIACLPLAGCSALAGTRHSTPTAARLCLLVAHLYRPAPGAGAPSWMTPSSGTTWRTCW